MFKYFIPVLVFFLGATNYADCQKKDKDNDILRGVIIDGDTIPEIIMQEVIIFPKRKFNNERERQHYYKLVRYVKKAYPYAKLAKKRLDEINSVLQNLPSEEQQKQYIDQMDDAIKAEFEDDIRDMTLSQGKILIKLIDRETGDSSYELIKQLKGSVTAFFWQGIAQFFGANLKTGFDPKNDEEDKLIEEIIKLIENGQL
ncbi:conserved hypothetical protein [sediment metagenome]|uniref:DUF4294 domain-containing protein n=1 Tax=sediment metagenome TaxID=749907 RepID=D9PJF0_9ZZZZ